MASYPSRHAQLHNRRRVVSFAGVGGVFAAAARTHPAAAPDRQVRRTRTDVAQNREWTVREGVARSFEGKMARE